MNKEKKEKPKESWGERQHKMRQEIDKWVEEETIKSRRKNSRRDLK